MADAHHAGDHEDFSDDSSSDPSQELYHHHHCPMTTVFDGSDGAILAFANKELLWPSKACGLGSRSSQFRQPSCPQPEIPVLRAGQPCVEIWHFSFDYSTHASLPI
ncbi:MAG: hypothetical protein IPO97_12870 [Sphingomonadales bacterium]|nr:hypothetical protein [Sphingomonadales bacterium]